MADGLITQGSVQAVAKDPGESGTVTQGAVHTLTAGAGPGGISQAMVLALVPSPAHESHTSQAYVVALTETNMACLVTQASVSALVKETPCLVRWAQCWRIERTDGEVFTFTSHDQPIPFQGETYQPCNSLSASASDLGAVLGTAGDVELSGIIADAAITEDDLYAGLFDRARVDIWLVPWQNAGGEIPKRLTGGITGSLRQGDEGFSMEVQTPGGLLQQQALLDTYTPSCRWELGDSRCGVDLDALAVMGTVSSVAPKDVSTRAHHRIFADSSLTEADGYFDQGTLEWTSGANTGRRSEIKSFASNQFVLWQPMQYPISIGDEYEARPGCDKTSDTCKTKFNNFVNYGGFPDVPGKDSILQTPDAKG